MSNIWRIYIFCAALKVNNMEKVVGVFVVASFPVLLTTNSALKTLQTFHQTKVLLLILSLFFFHWRGKGCDLCEISRALVHPCIIQVRHDPHSGRQAIKLVRATSRIENYKPYRQ